MKRVIFLCGNQTRHLFAANYLKTNLTCDLMPLIFPRNSEVKKGESSSKEKNATQSSPFGIQPTPSLAKYVTTHAEVVEILNKNTCSKSITLMFGYPLIFTQQQLERINGLFLNIHSGVLPNYRGVACNLFAAFIGDHENIGHTCHKVNDEIDAGELLKVTRAIPMKNESLQVVEARSLNQLLTAISKKINGMADIDCIRNDLTPQDISRSVYVRRAIINETFLTQYDKLYPAGILK